MKKNKLIKIFLTILVSLSTSPIFAADDGKGNKYFKDRVGIQVDQSMDVQAELQVNGSIIIGDGSQGLDKLLKTDANGLASWVPASYFPGLVGNNNSYNNLVINNGYFQDLYLNGLTTIDEIARFRAPGINNGYILSVQSNGYTFWSPNYGANGTSSDPLWLEAFNTIFPKLNNGENSIVLGSNIIANAPLVLHKNGSAHFNKSMGVGQDFNVGSNQSYFAIKVETDDDQVGIRLGSPDTRLDVLGMFALRGDGSDFTSTPDHQSSVFWEARNSSLGNNGDVLARINALGQDKVFKLVDFQGTTDGVTTQNGIILTNLTPERLVASDANKQLVSEAGIISNGGGFIGIGVLTPEAKLEIGDASLDHTDGIDDLSVRGDIEADGDIYATDFVGDTIGLYFNGVIIRNAQIHTSAIYTFLDVNGGAQIRAPDAPWFVDANLEFKGDVTFQTGNDFQLMGAPGPFPAVAFHVSNGLVGINTTSPTTNLDLNGRIAIRDGTEANGYLLTALDANGLANWEFHDTQNVNHAINVDNATTANFADNIVNGTITNSNFIGGVINGSTLVNVDLSNSPYASEWIDGPEGLYPKDGAAENVMVNGTTLASSTITLESNGTLTAVRFRGDFSQVTNIPYNQEWNDQGTYLHPFDLSGAEGMLVGGTDPTNSDLVFGPSGYAVINDQAQNADVKVQGQNEEYLFHTDGSADRVSINSNNPRATLDINGATSYFAESVALSAGTGLISTDIQNSRVIFLESASDCNVDLTASPQIAAGTDGQIITLIGRYSDEIITIEDGDGLALANNVGMNIAAKDSITLMYSSSLGEWLEIHRTNYIERVGDSLDRGTCI